VIHEFSGWIVWNFEYKPPYFENDDLALSVMFPQFANVYQVTSTKKGHQSFLKCDCLLYERCGIPCSHILKITDEIEATMIKNTTLESVSRFTCILVYQNPKYELLGVRAYP
jgi:hypothetical protein